MPFTSPMPPKNLAAVRISDRSTETQTQTGYPPSIGSGGLTPRSPVLALGSSCCAPDPRSGPSSSRPAVLDEPRRVASPDHSADCRFVAKAAAEPRLLVLARAATLKTCTVLHKGMDERTLSGAPTPRYSSSISRAVRLCPPAGQDLGAALRGRSRAGLPGSLRMPSESIDALGGHPVFLDRDVHRAGRDRAGDVREAGGHGV
jgi:hypothetical protein